MKTHYQKMSNEYDNNNNDNNDDNNKCCICLSPINTDKNIINIAYTQ